MKSSIRNRLNTLKNDDSIFCDDYQKKLESLYNDIKGTDLKKELYEASMMLGQLYTSRGHFLKALEYLNEADDISTYMNDFELKSSLYGALAIVYHRQHLPLYALYYRLEAESILQRNILDERQEFLLHKNYNNIGITYLELKMYDKAEDYLRAALKAVKYEDFDAISHISMLCNLVFLYSRTSSFDNALSVLSEIKKICEKEQDDFADYLHKLAQAEYETYQGNVIRAHFLYHDCLEYTIREFKTFEDVDLITSWVNMLREHKMYSELEDLTELIKEHSSEYVFDFVLLILENEYLIAKEKVDLTTALEKHEELFRQRENKFEQQQKLIYQNLDRIVNIARAYSNEKQSIYRDELTSCYNRTFLRKYFDKINKSRDNESDLTFLIMDVDKFKEYNDRYGHVKGDIVIKEVGTILNEVACLNNSYAIRYGGDEFLIVSPNKNALEGLSIALDVSQQLKSKEIVHAYSDVDDFITVTMGVASFNGGTDLDLSRCIATADIQLYKGKEAGRNCIYHQDKPIA